MYTSEQENMSDKDLTPPPDNTVLQIPESRDGFFGYPEEKTLQHVRLKWWARLIDELNLYSC